jgi:hypothetical protein
MHPPPPVWANFSIVMEGTVRQKAAIATQCVLCGENLLGARTCLMNAELSSMHAEQGSIHAEPSRCKLDPCSVQVETSPFNKAPPPALCKLSMCILQPGQY